MKANRFVEKDIKLCLKNFRVVQLLGSRQVGKTTVVKKICEELNGKYFTLDNFETIEDAKSNLDYFVNQAGDGLMVIDEVQLLPQLISQIKYSVDNNPKKGRFLLTGSANLLNLSYIHESLAGRSAIVEMFGFSQDELLGQKSSFVPNSFNKLISSDAYKTNTSREDYIEKIELGSYPELIFENSNENKIWFRSYLKTIVNRDAKDISQLKQLKDLPDILKYIASTQGQEFVASNLSRTIGIPNTTLIPYIELLETLFLTRSIIPWSKNLVKQVVKNRKQYIIDTGLATSLIRSNINYEGLFESFIIGELLKQISNSMEFDLYHFRDYEKKEIDIILEDDEENIVAIETKFSERIRTDWINTIREVRNKYQDKFKLGYIVYIGKEVKELATNIWAIPADYIWTNANKD